VWLLSALVQVALRRSPLEGDSMIEWLSVSLKLDLDEVIRKIQLPTYLEHAATDTPRRRSALEVAATLPGIRMCERRRCIQLTQSAPPVDFAPLSEVLFQLNESFSAVWPRLRAEHETILGRCRDHLAELNRYADLLQAGYVRRAEALTTLELITGSSGAANDAAHPFEPLLPFLGYEVDALLVPLRTIKFPDVLIKKTGRPWD